MEDAIALDSIQAIAASFGASFDAEKIIDTVLEKDGTRYYKVRWVKYSWEPAASFTHLEHLIRVFWNQYAENPENVNSSKGLITKVIEQASHTIPHGSEAQGKSVSTILNGLNPCSTDLHLQHQNLQLASFAQLHTVESTNAEQLEIIPNIQTIPLNIPQQSTTSVINNEVRKTVKSRKSKDPSDAPRKRRKIPGNCNICGKHFKSTTNIAAHRKLHTEERQFACPQCGKKFRRKLHLTRHLESHAGIKSFVCNICGSAFSSKWYMQAHAVVHTGDKPYPCDICEKRFNNKANLSKHKLIHANKRPFVCNECGQTYRQSYDLKRHMTTHSEEKKFRCDQCDKAFARKTYLQRHLLTHTGEKKFCCTICDRKFIQRGHLNFHMKQHIDGRSKSKHDQPQNEVTDADIILEREALDKYISKVSKVLKHERSSDCHLESSELSTPDSISGDVYDAQAQHEHLIDDENTEKEQFDSSQGLSVDTHESIKSGHCPVSRTNDLTGGSVMLEQTQQNQLTTDDMNVEQEEDFLVFSNSNQNESNIFI